MKRLKRFVFIAAWIFITVLVSMRAIEMQRPDYGQDCKSAIGIEAVDYVWQSLGQTGEIYFLYDCR